MLRRILLSACGSAALALLACSQEPDPEVVDTEPVVDEPVLTAPEATEQDSTSSDDLENAVAGRTGDMPVRPDVSGTTPENGSVEPQLPVVPETVSSGADPADMPEEAMPVDPILDSVAEFYGRLNGFQATAELNIQAMQANGELMPLPPRPSLIRELTLQRPNQFAVRVDDGGAPTVVSDGQTITAYLTDTDMFLEGAAPATLGGLSGSEIGMTVAFAGPFQMIPFILMGDNPRADLIDGVTESEYVGREDIDESPAHHLRFHQAQPAGEERTWDLWIASEGDPLVLQTSLVQQTLPTPSGPVTVSLVEKLRDWTLDPGPSDDTFAAVVPDTAQPARDVSDLFEPSLLGRNAPEVTLPLLGEGELNLASHEGASVVIMDFWATWCGPCRAGMPILAEVAEEYRDKGVVFYAVNIDESDEEIQTFLEDEGLALTVAKDAGGATAGLFGVSGIPHSVVIGKNGIVQSVHVGFSPELGTQLRRELDALLDGQDIFEGLPEEEADAAGDSPASDEAAEDSADSDATE